MIEITDGMKVLLSLVIGIIAAIIAKYIHPDWSQNQLFLFGFAVFAITAVLAKIVSSFK